MPRATKKEDLFFMGKALMQAEVALRRHEVPVGAVVVDANGAIIGRGFNKMESMHCQTGHAEIAAIEAACRKRGDWRLDDCTLYVTLEPCVMCFGLIMLSRFKRVVFGTQSPLFGFGLDNRRAFPLYKKDLKVQGGIAKEKCAEILKVFFKYHRKKKGML